MPKGVRMAKYLITGSYTQSGIQGVLKEGGTARKQAVEQFLRSMGGTVETFYFAFGADDFVVIVDGGNNVTSAAASMIVAAAGGAMPRVTVLLTPEEVDEAAKLSGHYRPPGQ